MPRASGFSLVELVLAMGVTAAVTSAVFAIVSPSQTVFSLQPEAADMQQRLRVAADALSKDLVMAGAGSYSGTAAGALSYYFAPVLPYRNGALDDDASGTFRADTITILYVPSTDAQTTLASDLTPASSTFSVNPDSGCPPGQTSCGFSDGDTVLIFDASGNFDTFTIGSIADFGGTITVNKPPDAAVATFKAGSKIVKAVDRTYSLKSDPASKVYQLVVYDGGARGDVPIADHVVGLTFGYFGDPQPPQLRRPGQPCDGGGPADGPCTTYGPAPPPLLGQPTPGYAPGENCVFKLDPVTGQQVPRLDVLGDGANATSTVRLDAQHLTDGPWCPDADSPNRFDADLLRIRTIEVTLRVEAASEAFRGPAGVLFAHGGAATDARRLLPDLEIRFGVSPRNLNLAR